MSEPTDKPCAKCGDVKPLEQFYANKGTRDGREGSCKACKLAYAQSYRQANREQLAERDRVYRELNREALSAKAKSRRDANAAALLPAARARYAALSREAKVRRRQLVAAWIAAHPDEMAEHARKKRAKRAAAVVGPVDLVALWTGDCGICGSTLDASLKWPDPFSKSVDHILPLARGGSHTQENIQWAHLACNTTKGARTVERTPNAEQTDLSQG